MQKSISFGLVVVMFALVAGQGSAGSGGARTQASEAIVFELEGDLYAVAVDGSRTVQLTKTRVPEFEPAVSPDGGSIAYTRGPLRGEDHGLGSGFVNTAGGQLWAVALDGKHRRVTKGPRDSDPAWSPDGDTIYFSRVVKGAYHEPCRAIFRIGKDGGDLHRVTRTIPGGRPDGELNPVDAPQDLAVSPDGLRIAFTDEATCETTDTQPNLEVVDTSGRVTRDLSRLPPSSYRRSSANPTWAPDGSRVAYERDTVYVANRDGSGSRRVVPRRKAAESAAWSPDGDWIAFVGRGDIYVIHPDGTELRQVTRTKELERAPAWLPRMPTG
jgi:Tol biopolymer transport system component